MPYWTSRGIYGILFSNSSILSNINQGAAAAASSAITAVVGGVTEPAMFGINLRLKKPLYAAMIGNFFGAGFAGLMKVHSFAFSGSTGIFAVLTKTPNLYMIISIIINCVGTFVTTLFIYDGEDIY
jgi:PTS system beta-glucosides-specific IIC component